MLILITTGSLKGSLVTTNEQCLYFVLHGVVHSELLSRRQMKKGNRHKGNLSCSDPCRRSGEMQRRKTNPSFLWSLTDFAALGSHIEKWMPVIIIIICVGKFESFASNCVIFFIWNDGDFDKMDPPLIIIKKTKKIKTVWASMKGRGFKVVVVRFAKMNTICPCT